MIRPLTLNDFENFYFIRRQALVQNPEAFGTKLAAFDGRPLEKTRQRFAASVEAADRFILGAFNPASQGGRIVGMAGFGRLFEPADAPIGFVWGVFVMGEARGQGYGRQLIKRTIELARQIPNMALARLSVVRTNEAAIALYEQNGFRPFQPEPLDAQLDGPCGSELHMQCDLRQT